MKKFLNITVHCSFIEAVLGPKVCSKRVFLKQILSITVLAYFKTYVFISNKYQQRKSSCCWRCCVAATSALNFFAAVGRTIFYLSLLVQVGGVTRDTCAETGPWLGSGPFNVSIMKNLNFHQATAIVADPLSLYVRMVKQIYQVNNGWQI